MPVEANVQHAGRGEANQLSRTDQGANPLFRHHAGAPSGQYGTNLTVRAWNKALVQMNLLQTEAAADEFGLQVILAVESDKGHAKNALRRQAIRAEPLNCRRAGHGYIFHRAQRNNLASAQGLL